MSSGSRSVWTVPEEDPSEIQSGRKRKARGLDIRCATRAACVLPDVTTHLLPHSCFPRVRGGNTLPGQIGLCVPLYLAAAPCRDWMLICRRITAHLANLHWKETTLPPTPSFSSTPWMITMNLKERTGGEPPWGAALIQADRKLQPTTSHFYHIRDPS